MPALAADVFRVVAAETRRAKASVAAVRICSRRCARGRRRTGSGPSATTIDPSRLLVNFEVYFLLCLTSSSQEVVGPRRAIRWSPRTGGQYPGLCILLQGLGKLALDE